MTGSLRGRKEEKNSPPLLYVRTRTRRRESLSSSPSRARVGRGGDKER